MKKSEINKLCDKDLQLRYYLGGLELISDGEEQLCNYWTCDINCSCLAVPDDERLAEVKKFINKHNLTNERLIKMSYWMLTGSIMKYKGTYSPLFIELEKIMIPYHFTRTERGKIPDNDFKEKELENISNEPIVKNFCSKYHLDVTDFIVLAKTRLNFMFTDLQVAKNSNDTFSSELFDILDSHGLYVSREQIEEYRKEYKNIYEVSNLVIDAKAAQKRYLELMKELQTKESNLTIKMISEELNELGFNSKKDINKLILRKK